MKKRYVLLLTTVLLFGCNGKKTVANNSSSVNNQSSSIVDNSVNSPNNEDTTSSNSSTDSHNNDSSSSINSNSSVNSTSSNVISTSENSQDDTNYELLSLKEIIDEANKLENDVNGKKVALEANYVAQLTDNMDKLMLFSDGIDYLYVRVVGGFNDFLKNRYLDCNYYVEGTVRMHNGNTEVIYSSLNNLTSTPEKINLDNVKENKNSLEEVVDEYKKVILNNKDTGVGKIVSFKGTIISTEYAESNSKLVVFDGNKTITVVSDKKIVNKDDVGKEFEFTGVISILKSSPAIWSISAKYVKDSPVEDLSFTNVVEVSPSYFSKWYYVSDRISKPSMDDYTTLYKVTGYLSDDYDRTSAGKFYLGMMDEYNKSLSDSGYNKSIKGIYLMNQQGLTSYELSLSVFEPYYEKDQSLSIYASLYQFDTLNHGWKMFSIESLVA